MKKPITLIIMDGYGIDKASPSNAVTQAKKPVLDYLFKEYPNTVLEASGEAVGLPEGQMGNSEVGHLNLGAGRIVYQSLTKINVSIKDGSFKENKAINEAIQNSLDNNKKFHIIGLCSDGGVHSHTSHIKTIADLCLAKGIKTVYYHPFLDGRDVAPDSALTYLNSILECKNVKVGSVSGRYYSMDRDKNWDRTEVAYNALTKSVGKIFPSAKEGIEESYKNGKLDEFVEPFIVDVNGNIESGDSVVFANFRPDRAIQIATALSNPLATQNLIKNPTDHKLNIENAPQNIHFVSMMKYADSVLGDLAFPLVKLDNLFGDVISANNMKQLRIAETEKYAHVTFFFDGGEDKEIKGSDRILVNSPKVATYDLQPSMSTYEVTNKVVEAIGENKYDTIILNFANCDMVGHTGNIEAAINAVSVVDECVGKVYEAVKNAGGVCLITADHGNAEKMKDENGNVFTAHTTNLVPLIVTDKSIKLEDKGILSDITPTMLELLGIKKPESMTSKSLIKK